MRCQRCAVIVERSIAQVAWGTGAGKLNPVFRRAFCSQNACSMNLAFGMSGTTGRRLATRSKASISNCTECHGTDITQKRKGRRRKISIRPFRVFLSPCDVIKTLVWCCKRRWGGFGSGSLIGRWQFSLCGWRCYRVGIAGAPDDQRRKQQTGQCDTHVNS